MLELSTESKVLSVSFKKIHVSPMKVKRVIDLIRGQKIDKALRLLQFMRYTFSVECLNYLSVLNRNLIDLGYGDNIYIQSIYVTPGKTRRKYQCRAQGRAYMIRKRSSILSVTVIGNKSSSE